MPHPFFDADKYPWHRADARELKVQLRTLIPNVPEIVAIYERSGGDKAWLNQNAAPDDVWQSALNLLAAARLLQNFINELASIARLQHNASFQAAIRAVREAQPSASDPVDARPIEDFNRQIDGGHSRQKSSRLPIAVGIVIGIVVLAFLFFFISTMAQNVFRIDVPWLPGTGQGGSSEEATGDPIPRLQNGPVTADSAGVVTTIERVDQRGDITEIELTVQNNLADTITLPLSVAALMSADGTTVSADPFAGDWTESIPAGVLRRGTIVFKGTLPPAATSATFSFSTAFVQGPGGPDAIVVPDLAIAAVPQ